MALYNEYGLRICNKELDVTSVPIEYIRQVMKEADLSIDTWISIENTFKEIMEDYNEILFALVAGAPTKNKNANTIKENNNQNKNGKMKKTKKSLCGFFKQECLTTFTISECKENFCKSEKESKSSESSTEEGEEVEQGSSKAEAPTSTEFENNRSWMADHPDDETNNIFKGPVYRSKNESRHNRHSSSIPRWNSSSSSSRKKCSEYDKYSTVFQ